MVTQRSFRPLLLAFAACCVAVMASCSSDNSANTTTTAPKPVEIDWEVVKPGGDCMCADGSEYAFSVRAANPKKVLVFFQGGGACFSEETCDFEDGKYLSSLELPGSGKNQRAGATTAGVFDIDNDENPFADYSMVFVPYCTGDVHIGTKTTTYGTDLEVHHVGYINAMSAIDETRERFPDATDIVVAGVSAGSAPSPLYAGILADSYPDARISVIADGSGAYPDVPGLNAAIGSLWGALGSVPPNWESTKGVTAEQWSLPGLFAYAGTEHPDIVFSRHDYAYDETQEFFAELAGIDPSNLLGLIDDNEELVEARGTTLSSFIAPGSKHTILMGDGLYDETVDGESLLDWITSVADHTAPGDVHCVDCGTSANAGSTTTLTVPNGDGEASSTSTSVVD